MVCGGPGTGKSSLLMGIVLATLATALPLKILVCAKLPGSCNRLTEELRKRRPDFLIMRVGDVKDMDDESQSLVMNGVKIETGQAVVVATLRDSYLTRDFFEQIDVILVDDAQQASDLDLLVALALRPKKLILVGDFQQPGVVLRDASLRRRLLHRSLMHRISEMKNDNE